MSRGRNEVLNVLFVDDQYLLIEHAVRALDPQNYRVQSAQSLSEAKALIESNRDDFDIAFVDIGLGVENGLELLPLLMDKGIMAVVLTGQVEREVEAAALGAVDYLLKPISADGLQTKLAMKSGIIRAIRDERERVTRLVGRLHSGADAAYGLLRQRLALPAGLLKEGMAAYSNRSRRSINTIVQDILDAEGHIEGVMLECQRLIATVAAGKPHAGRPGLQHKMETWQGFLGLITASKDGEPKSAE